MNKLIYLGAILLLTCSMSHSEVYSQNKVTAGSEENKADPFSYIEIKNAKVAYQVDGEGPGLVLIPGTGGNAENSWGALLDYFTPYRTVVRPEYSGAGRTEDDGTPLTIEKVAAQVIAAAEAAGAVPFDLIGYSLGGSIAAYIAAEYPEKVRSVVLLTAFAKGDSRSKLQLTLWKELIQKDLPSMAKLVLLGGLSPDYLSQMTDTQIEELLEIIIQINDWEGMLRQIDLDLSLDIRKQLPLIRKPTLVIGCTHDQILPPSGVRELANTIPEARYEELNSGHLVILERPAEFAQIALKFLRENE